MNLKKRLALGVFISTLLAFSAYYAEYLPFTGKWIAAYRMDRYAQEQYPGFHCGKVYFNPCGAPYDAVLTGDSGQEVELGCGYDGLIGMGVGLAFSFAISMFAEVFTYMYYESKN